MADLERAIALAVEAHRGQQDKVGQPYILHPLRVMFRCETEIERMVAVLHDVVEDTSVTMEDLRAAGFGDEVLVPLDCVTQRKGESYEQFIARAGSHPVARKVKIADIEDNMDIRRLPAITPKDAARLERYIQHYHQLKAMEK